jgi:tartrate-resistant acid phosphatase type 5
MPKIVHLCLLAAGAINGAVPAFGAPEGTSTGPQVNLLFVGDWGFNPPAKPTPEQVDTARAMAAYARSNLAALDAVLVGGDNFKAKLSGPDDPNFLLALNGVYDPTQIRAPFYAVFGSHDYEYKAADAQLQHSRRHPESRWKMPDRWYRLDLPAQNPLVTVFMLETDRSVLKKTEWETELRWLDTELAKPHPSAWTICLGHHPLFSDGQHGDDAAMQAAVGPLLKKHKVHFYLAGHDHVLNHLELAGWETSFVISGGGGENIKRPLTGTRSHFVKSTHGFAGLQFSPASAKVSLVNDTGAVLHEFERDRAGQIRILRTSPSDRAGAPSKK